MKRIFLVEDYDSEHLTFESFEDAVKYATNYIDAKPQFTDSEKVDLFKELIQSIVDRDTEKWGQGYSIDEMLWCWEIPYYQKGTYTEEAPSFKQEEDKNE